MSTLFTNTKEDNGYRLSYLEVFNWGTFNGKVAKLKPDSRTSLLTGANGSGKTTLIDALLTLLVPNNKRFYNQSSGAASKTERSELSYFWGSHGTIFSDTDERKKTEQLRNKADKPYSILLACFQNTSSQHTVTLVQARWFSNGGLQKVFLVAPYPLTIEEHFGKDRFDFKGDWKKKLVKLFPKTEIYNSFKEYAAKFSELFGLKDKALSLFNKTVGIKVLGDLTTFIRQEMLDEANAEEEFKKLYEHYSDLLISHKAIQKDEKQLELLQPIITNKVSLDALQIKKAEFELIEGQMQFYLNKIEYNLLITDIERLETERKFAKQEKQTIVQDIEVLDKEKEQLITQKAALDIDSQIQSLKKDIDTEVEKERIKKGERNQYVGWCKQLKLDIDVDEKTFKGNYTKILGLQKSIPTELEELNGKKYKLKIEQEDAKNKIEGLQQQITSLQSRKNRIPDDLINARRRLLAILEISEDEIPFVGELIKVKATEQNWEDAIEKLLHSFSMQLLVPEKFNKAVNEFVYNNNIQTKLVYQKIDKRPSNSIFSHSKSNDELINKVSIKEGTIYDAWIETMLMDRFNYYCTDDLEVFYGSQKALTSNGLIRNKYRHEKDDRPDKWNKSKYRLGWDNKATIQYFQEEKYKEEKRFTNLAKAINEITPILNELTEKDKYLTLIANVDDYNKINWQQHTEKINKLNIQVSDLEKSSDAFTLIKKQLTGVEEKLKVQHAKKDEFVTKIAKLDEAFNHKNLKILTLQFDELNEPAENAIIAFLKEENLPAISAQSLTNFGNTSTQILIKLRSKQKLAENALKLAEQQTITFIAAFVNPSEKIITAFPNWSGDTINIKADLTGLEDLEELYKTIQSQRLVEHKKRFNDYMDKSMLDALTSYNTWLNNELSKIEDMIEDLNLPLKKITFNKNPDTYLQLECRKLRGGNEINLFRNQLAAAIPSVYDFETQKDDAYRQQVFEKIKVLITELQKEEIWRKKVTDVRNWLLFSAKEYTIADNKPGQYHEDTASNSGGETAQLTYAILGSAIAYQFGIFQQGKQHKSLRFITVDEAFSKLDPEKSQFLMEFCAQLNLQILIVTPLDKINIAEPYISAVHFVEKKSNKNSIAHNLTMEQYFEQKEAFHQLALQE